jgi:N-acetylglucosamine kinase-like BadF-type ATPase
MIGIFEAGGTKTEFISGNAENLVQRTGPGIHPMFMDEEAISSVLKELTVGVDLNGVKEIWFYGASCAGHELAGKVRKIMEGFFPSVRIWVESDLLGTARALCGRAPGFAAILGTGSNACLYDGRDISRGMLSFGFWLGDEGSGGYIGKAVFRAWLKGELTSEQSSEAESLFGSERETALQSILEDRKPNARIARLGGMAIRRKAEPFFSSLVRKCLNDFLEENKELLSEAGAHFCHFSGSVAFYLKEEISELLYAKGLKPGVFADRTAERLFHYHLTQAI